MSCVEAFHTHVLATFLLVVGRSLDCRCLQLAEQLGKLLRLLLLFQALELTLVEQLLEALDFLLSLVV